MSQSEWFDQAGDDAEVGRDSGPSGSHPASSRGSHTPRPRSPWGPAGRSGRGPGGGAPAPPLRMRRRGPLLPTLIVLIVLAILLSALASLWTDVLWYDSIGFRRVFTTELFTKLGLFAVGGAFVGAVVWSSLKIAYRSRPIYAPVTPQQQTLDQYREAIEPVRRVAMVGIPVVLGLLTGAGAAGQWKTFLLWRNSVPFGKQDPEFGKDLSFFVFTLPWLEFLLGFVTMALVMALVAAAVTHYVYGGIQLQGRGQRTTHAARTHLALLLAALVVVRAASYWVGRYALETQNSQLMTGITYTDAHAVLPTKAILAVASLMCAAMFVASIWTRSWRLPLVGVGLLTVTAIVVGGIYPALFQALKVNPSEKTLESKYIARSIQATRDAYGLSGVEVTPYQAKTTATQGQLRNDAETIPGIRLIDPVIVPPTFKQLQSIKSYYGFPDALDVDRYKLDGKLQDTVIAVRELELGGVPPDQRNWLNDHTVYTHGFGVVAAYGNRPGPDGRPDFFEQDIPSTGALGKFEPRIYFGEESPLYSIVGGAPGTTPKEFDYPDASGAGQKNNTYAGNGGVAIGSLPRQLAYAIKYRELKFLLSDAVNSHSRLLDHREPLERLHRAAPWLTTDGNPYPAVVDGRVLWIVDGYTTSASYPYSRLQDIDSATSDSVTERSTAVTAINSGQINYMRNSVKATVDAFDGSVHLYTWDEQDPVLQAWSKAFPGTVQPRSAISGDLMAHLRYPEDLFKVQRKMLSDYHVTDPLSFYGGNDYWRVPRDPAQGDPNVQQPPFYLSVAMPGQTSPAFSLTTTFMPTGDRQVLSGFLAVDSDAGSNAGQPRKGYGTMRLLELPRDSTVKGPGQVQSDISSSNQPAPPFSTLALSQFINTNQQHGSSVLFGNLLTLPVGAGLLYVEPLYVRGQSSSPFPLLRAVVVTFGDKLAWDETLDKALDRLFGGNSGAKAGDSGTGTTPAPSTPGTPGSSGTPGPSGSGNNAALAKALAEIQQAYAQGQAALKAGDFTAYGQAQQRLGEAIKAAIAAEPKGGTTQVKPSPTSTPTPSRTR